ncbi:MAG: hypothetical protein WBE34_16835 [Candidatus Nitrosopolaris sp.]|jgi:hypothetical protein
MSKHERMETVLRKLYFIEDAKEASKKLENKYNVTKRGIYNLFQNGLTEYQNGHEMRNTT